MHSTEKVAKYAYVYYISFYVLMVFIILNLFIGVVVGAMQSAEEEIFNKSDDDTNTKQLILLEKLKKQLDHIEKKLESRTLK